MTLSIMMGTSTVSVYFGARENLQAMGSLKRETRSAIGLRKCEKQALILTGDCGVGLPPERAGREIYRYRRVSVERRSHSTGLLQ
jgi:hypothetical protein